MTGNKPLIYTYFQDSQIYLNKVNLEDLMSLKNFKDKLSQLGHYYTIYKNIDELKYRFSEQLNKFVPKLADNLLEIPISERSQLSDPKTTAKYEVKLKTEKGVDYTKLSDLLAAGEWKKADIETANVMLEAANRKKEGWLREEDIDNFPCEDLRITSQLWLHYSNGKFGFSVQKEIYESLLETREYNHDIYQEFGIRVRWKREENWLNYSEIIFNLNAPCGHLPAKMWSIGHNNFYRLGRFSSLTQRLVTCKI